LVDDNVAPCAGTNVNPSLTLRVAGNIVILEKMVQLGTVLFG
jgi:hypothetical protein